MENTKSVVETVSSQLIEDIFKASALEEIKVPEVENIVNDKEPLPNPPEEVETRIVEEIEKPKSVYQTDYSKRLKGLLEDGIIDNFAINYNVDGKDQEVFLEDIEDLTEEGYKQILEGVKSAKKNEIDSKYIEKGNLDEHFLKVIETRKAGGDITEIIRENVTAIDQLTQLKDNIDNEQVQINIVAHSLQQQGIKDSVIKGQIRALVDDGSLEVEANLILDSHLEEHQNAIEQKRQVELQRVEREKEDNKNLRKSLVNEYKEMGLPEKAYKVFVDNATNLDQDKISNSDKIYFKLIQDPKTAPLVNFFLNDMAGYDKYISSRKVMETKIKDVKAAFSVNIHKTNKPKLSSNSLEEFVDEAIKNNNN